MIFHNAMNNNCKNGIINSPGEEWRDIPGNEGKYQVSNHGRIKTLARDTRCGRSGVQHRPEYLLKQTDNPYGYLICSCGFVHRCVAQAFIPNPNGYPEVNHINGNKHDNRVDNLEWCSRGQNMKHAYVMGLKQATKEFLRMANVKRKRIRQIDKQTGETIAEYPSALAAAQYLERDQGNITRAALGLYKTAYGFKWEYIDIPEE